MHHRTDCLRRRVFDSLVLVFDRSHHAEIIPDRQRKRNRRGLCRRATGLKHVEEILQLAGRDQPSGQLQN